MLWNQLFQSNVAFNKPNPKYSQTPLEPQPAQQSSVVIVTNMSSSYPATDSLSGNAKLSFKIYASYIIKQPNQPFDIEPKTAAVSLSQKPAGPTKLPLEKWQFFFIILPGSCPSPHLSYQISGPFW